MQAGDVISYLEMCNREGASLQRGMNYRLGPDHSVLLMSLRSGAPYEDQVRDGGRTLIYEGHDVTKSSENPNPKSVDQPFMTPTGSPTQNGLFYQAAEEYRNGESPPERVRVYEKVRQGIWVYNGLFHLLDAWQEESGTRTVLRFKLALADQASGDEPRGDSAALEHSRVIPTSVKLAVWKRDQGRCIQCGATDNLHFDHIIPYSKGGTSLSASNIQLLCARHNLEKRDDLR